MRPEGRKSPKLLITTNLDNDDAFSSDVVELLQRELRPAPGKRIYSLLYGYQYFTDRRFALKMRYTNNHFLTLAEPFDARAETIISYRHTKAIRQLPTTYLSTARGKWLEIVHEDNVSNDFRINIKVWYIPLLYGRSFADFGLGGFRLSCARQWAATLLVVPARFCHGGTAFAPQVVEITLSRPEKAAMLPQTTGGIALYSTRYGTAALPQPRVFVVETEPDAQHQVVRGLEILEAVPHMHERIVCDTYLERQHLVKRLEVSSLVQHVETQSKPTVK